MPATATQLDQLADMKRWSYHLAGPVATEPAALSAWALTVQNRTDTAVRPLDWLAQIQAANGSLGVTATERSPRWPTSLAILAWSLHDRATGKNRYAGCIERAVQWALSSRGKTLERKRQIGHDTTLVAWPWVIGTHSWQEPTAFFVIALSAAGHAQHPRIKQAVQLLVDRLLPRGGCNYGNTLVLGRELLPHVQPTGLTLLALAGKGIQDPRIESSIRYLETRLGPEQATASLCFGLMGLTTHGRRPAAAPDWLDAIRQRHRVQPLAAYHLALIALATTESPILATNPTLTADPAMGRLPMADYSDLPHNSQRFHTA